MSKIWLTSDTHFGHDREFVWGPRGFNNVEEHDQAIIENWNKVVAPGDTVYHLGDVMLGDNKHGLECLEQLNGKIYIVKGNHDTVTREKLYFFDCDTVKDINPAYWIKYNGITFYLSHFPTITSNLEKSANLKEHIINLYGHTHQKTNFYEDIPFMYHVGVDSHNCTPILIDDIVKDIENKAQECVKYL